MSEPLTPDIYQKLYQQHGTIAGVARALGRNERSLRRWVARNIPKGIMPAKEPDREPEVLLPYLMHPQTVEELADKLDKGPSTIRRWLEKLQGRGFNIQQIGDKWSLDKAVVPAETHVDHVTKETHLKIAIVSDTQLGSKCQQLTYLNDFYDRCASRGIKRVYNAGDILAGVNVYKGQHQEIFLHTEDEQIDYAVERYPKRDGIETHAIGGNHDMVFVKGGGADPLKVIADRRPDIHYLGPYSAWVQLAPNCTMYLLHPEGSPAYALSYRLQKIIESFEGGRKPNILVVGHWHSWCDVFVRNVHGVLAMCFEAQTDYERRHALQPVIGGLILDIDFEDNGSIHSLKYERINYLVPKERDYQL